MRDPLRGLCAGVGCVSTSVRAGPGRRRLGGIEYINNSGGGEGGFYRNTCMNERPHLHTCPAFRARNINGTRPAHTCTYVLSNPRSSNPFARPSNENLPPRSLLQPSSHLIVVMIVRIVLVLRFFRIDTLICIRRLVQSSSE